ncbi:MAG: hypothetical protein KGL43_00975 [Burkholderiales bacterium]|nr:hypothetical protein [Burkholderiales bacterium]MDE2452139.1 hypothetical protein [Burkholderiales bacterium]
MLNCKETTELCSQELERALGIGEQLSLHLHLMMCSGCTNFRKQAKMLREVMGRYADGQAPSAEEDAPRD